MTQKVLIKGFPTPKGDESIRVNKTLQPVKKGQPRNMEVEEGEIIVGDFDSSGFPSLFKAGGERHSNGGTDINAPENSFIFSRDKALKLKNSEIQKAFGKKEKDSGYNFAEIAKQYDINKYRKVLADPDSDNLQRDTAEQMIKNYNEKLGKLSLVQESMKGMPDGIPFIAIPYMESMGIDPAGFIHGGNGDEPEVATQAEENDNGQMKFGGGMKVKVVAAPKYQFGGPKNKKESVYSATQLANMKRAKELGHNLTIPDTVIEQFGAVDKTQKKLPTNVYGRHDWSSAKLFPDFASRAKWYLKEHPEFDPRKPKDVEEFQKAYNNRLVSMGYQPELNVDKKFGEHTYSVYDLNKLPEPNKEVINSPVVNNKKVDLQAPVINGQQAEENTPFWTEDIAKMFGAFGDSQRIKKYMPWQAGYNVQLPEGIYYDPTRELAANSEQANIAGQALSTYAGAQTTSARLSEVQGHGLAGAADIIGKYNNLNVSAATQLENARKSLMNSDSANRADLATGLFDKTVLTNQNFDNAKAMARGNIRESFINAWTNRGKTQALNSTNKQFRVNPLTGFVDFTGKAGQIDGKQKQAQIEDTFNKLMENPHLKSDPKLAYKMALDAHGIDSKHVDMGAGEYPNNLPK